MGRFDGRVAVITGAARGIGFGIARRFAAEGASVAILDLDEDASEKELQNMDDELSEEEQDKVEAFFSYADETCSEEPSDEES